MSSMFLIPILKTAVLPFVITFLAVFLAGKFWRPEAENRDWIAGLGLLLGYLVGFFSITGLNQFPPIQVTHWLPYTALFMAPLLWLSANRSVRTRALLTILALACLLWIHLKPRFQAWSPAEAAVWLVVLGLTWLLAWAVWRWAVGAGERQETPLAMVMVATGVSLVCIYGSAKMSQLSGVLASAAGGLFLARLAVARIRLGAVANGVFLTLFGGLMIHALIYAEIDPVALVLVYLTIFSILLPKLPFFSGRHWLMTAVVLALITGLILTGAMLYLDYITVEDDYGY